MSDTYHQGSMSSQCFEFQVIRGLSSQQDPDFQVLMQFSS